MLNATISSNSSNNAIYVDSVYTSLAGVPATIIGIISVNLLGGKIMLGRNHWLLETFVLMSLCSAWFIYSMMLLW